jgi:4-hydroxy-3-methylbut-2-enyl diphosphate reductase
MAGRAWPGAAKDLVRHLGAGLGIDMRVILAQPRGFCAGVVRAIDIVEKALDKYGEPVYVRHEIVHNKHVVDTLKNKGARFV